MLLLSPADIRLVLVILLTDYFRVSHQGLLSRDDHISVTAHPIEPVRVSLESPRRGESSVEGPVSVRCAVVPLFTYLSSYTSSGYYRLFVGIQQVILSCLFA